MQTAQEYLETLKLWGEYETLCRGRSPQETALLDGMLNALADGCEKAGPEADDRIAELILRERLRDWLNAEARALAQEAPADCRALAARIWQDFCGPENEPAAGRG